MSHRSSHKTRVSPSRSMSASLAQVCMQALEGRTYFGGQFGGTDIGQGGRGGQGECNCSDYPVVYEAGVPLITATDLQSKAFGHTFGQTRNWVGVDNSGLNGNGWLVTDLPYLTLGQSQADGGMVQLIKGGGNAEQFFIGNNDTTFTYQDKNHLSLKYIPSYKIDNDDPTPDVYMPGIFELTDEHGNITSFYDLPRDATAYQGAGAKYGRLRSGYGYTQETTNQWFNTSSGTRYDGGSGTTSKYRFGAFAGYRDASGHYTVTAVYDSNGNLTNVRRTDGSGSYEQLLYTYKTIDNGTASDTLVESVALQSGYDAGGIPNSWTTKRYAVYQYYEGGTASIDDSHGRLGDLKFAATADSVTQASTSALAYSSITKKVTVTTSANHGYAVGDMVAVTGAAESEFNGVFRITDIVSGTQFKYAISSSSNSSGSGTIKVNRPLNVDYYRYYKFHAYNAVADSAKVGTARVGAWNAIDGSGDDKAGGTDITFPARNNGGLDNDNYVMSGLKAVVDGPAFARLTASYDGSIESLPDFDFDTDSLTGSDDNDDGNYLNDDIRSYANNFFLYERFYSNQVNNVPGGAITTTLYRVAQEVAAGSGCSTCSGGFGTTKLVYVPGSVKADPFDADGTGLHPNQWVMKTIEYLPDETNTFVTHDLDPGDLASSSAIATVDWTSHGLSIGDYVTIKGASDPAFNGTFKVATVPNNNSFTYTLPYTPDDDSPTGTITVTASTSWSDNDYNVIYTNELAQVILKVQVDNNGTASTTDNIEYLTYNRYDDAGRLIYAASPSALKGYSESYGDLVNWDSGTFVNSNSGLITETKYAPATTATTSVAGNVAGYEWYTAVQRGQLAGQKAASLTHGASSATATITVSGGHGYSNGDIIEISGATSTNAVFNGSYVISNVTSTTFDIDVATSTPTVSGIAAKSYKPILQRVNQYIKHTDAGNLDVYKIASTTIFDNPDQTGSRTTSHDYTWYTDTNRIKTDTVTKPIVDPAHHGAGGVTGNQTVSYFDTNDRAVWTKDESNYINYIGYDAQTGAVAKRVRNVQYSLLDGDEQDSFDETGWTEPSKGLHLTTSYVVDSQGRVTQETDANGNVTYTVYNDADHEVRRYRGWDATTHTTTGPIEIHREYRPEAGENDPTKRIAFTEDLKIAAPPNLDGNDKPDGTETISDSNIVSLTRSLTNDAGQVIERDAYFSFGGGFSYDPQTAHLGSQSNDSSTGNYHAKFTDYDSRSRVKRVVSPSGTIVRTLYDVRGLVTSKWIGTDDKPVSDYWSPTNTAGTNLVKVLENAYDYGRPGDGSLTKTTQYPGRGAAARVTTMWYDWRDRLVLQKEAAQASEDATTNRPITYYDYDNQNRQTSVARYDGDQIVQLGAISTAPIVDNGSFEASGSTITPWSSSGSNNGLSLDSSTSTPYGTRSLTKGYDDDSGWTSVSQVIGNWDAGTYDIKVYAAGKHDYIASEDVVFYVKIDNVIVDSFTRDSISGGSDETIPCTVTGGTHTLTIEADFPLATAFVQLDNIRVEPVSSVVDSDGDSVPDRPADTLMQSKNDSLYDETGRVYQSKIYNINGDTSPGSLNTDYWYDPRGNVIKIRQPGGLVTKTVYDGAGRTSKVYQTDGGGDVDTVYGDASSVSGDTVLEQTENCYDANGNAIFTINKKRAHDSTITGDLPGAVANPLAPRVVGRWLFYNDSGMDGNDSAAGSSDDDAIANEITPLLPGAKNAAGHVSGYARGINGVMIDIQNLPDTVTSLSAADFILKVGTSTDLGSWSAADDPDTITIRRGEGVDGSDRVELIWGDGDAPQNKWLQVTVKADTLTGLAAPDVFYFGSLVGDLNGNGTVDSSDVDLLADTKEFHLNVNGDITYSDSFTLYEGAPYSISANSEQSDGGSWMMDAGDSAEWYYADLFYPPSSGAGLPLDINESGGGDWTAKKFGVGSDHEATLDATVHGILRDDDVTNGPPGGDIDGDGDFDGDDLSAIQSALSNTLANLHPHVDDRVTYAEYYYDAANRQTDSVDLGTNSGTPKLNPDAYPPARSNAALRTSHQSETNEIQYIDVTGVGTGNFTLSFGGYTTAVSLPYNADRSNVQFWLSALASIGNYNVRVTDDTDGFFGNGYYTVEFVGRKAATDLPAITASAGVSVTTLHDGSAFVSSDTDARGISTYAHHDALGRTTKAVANYVDGSPSNSDDQTIEYTYDGNGSVLTMKAVLPSSTFQTTQHVYGWEKPVTITHSGSTATAHLDNHGFKTGQEVTISGANSISGTNYYNGTFTITVTDNDHFTYTVMTASNPGADATKPDGDNIWVRPASAGLHTLSSSQLTRSGSVATVTYNSHPYNVGDQITINGANQSEYNGTFVVTAKTTNTFAFIVVGSPASPATGTISVTYSDPQNNDLQSAVRYPDKSSGSASTSEQETFTTDALGERTAYTDRNGSTHSYSYDLLGRMTFDDVTGHLGSGVNTAVTKIGYTYNGLGLPERISSYNSSGTVVNEIKREYNGLGQLRKEYQDHSDSVGGSEANVEYVYSEMEGGANHSRLKSIKYPNGRILHFVYTTSSNVVSDGVNDAISRLTFLADDNGSGSPGTTHPEEYEYLGLDTIVGRIHPQSGVNLVYYDLSGTNNGPAGDHYTGLDAFDRVIDQRWTTSGGADKDRFKYSYDRNGNVLTKDNDVHSTNDEDYAYDDLNRLTGFERDTRDLNWTLDALGNMDSIGGDISQDRTHNSQNQIVGGVGTTPAYDANGNLTTDQNNKTLTYDAWNRVVASKTGGATDISYAYDGTGRRISSTVSGTTTDYYFSDQWQVLEEKVGGTTRVQYVWSPIYVNAMVLRDRDSDSNGSLEERVYPTHDANYNITAIIGTGSPGTILERFAYDPYGARTVLNASTWASTSDSYAFLHGFQGGKADAVTGRINFQKRDYDVDLMRWVQQDYGVGYKDGMNIYGSLGSNPLSYVDPHGEERKSVYVDSAQEEDWWAGVWQRLSGWGITLIDDPAQLEPILKDAVGGQYSPDGEGCKNCIDYLSIGGHGSEGRIRIGSGRKSLLIAPNTLRDQTNYGSRVRQFVDSIEPYLCNDATVEFVTCESGKGDLGEELWTNLEERLTVNGKSVYVKLYAINVEYTLTGKVVPAKQKKN